MVCAACFASPGAYSTLACGVCCRVHTHTLTRSSHIPFFSWTLVTSTFSHAEPGHALFNGLTFWFLVPTALAVLGNAQFLVLYLGSTSKFDFLPAPPGN